ncbi:uncharacterized protein LOC129741152 [Uranotaenia lowii]|uniref:uncharacterized protein LOC129741152 n=1 Tax=Uranotaenia lowii TaxID=190385 RepID=UPI0024784B79|nr:uncharacterized protein LOC129741152 [Uranotaenia lowii]
MFIYLLLAVLLAAFWWVRNCYNYWNHRNVPHAAPSFPFGNLGELKQKPLFLLLTEYYNRFKGPGIKFVGLYFFLRPVVVMADLDWAKNVLVRDFQHFHDRGVYNNEKAEPLEAHLITLEGTRWKDVRSKLTPAFTSGKMKLMFATITAVAEQFRKQIMLELEKGDEVEMKDFLARFTTDVIGSCAFGLECNSLEDPKAMFREMGRLSMEQTPKKTFLRNFTNTFRSLSKFLGLKVTNQQVEDFFFDAVRKTINYRKTNDIRRDDFLDTLIRMQKDETSMGDADLGGWQFYEIVAQCFVFFLAGFETSSTAMSFFLYEMARNQDVQEKARNNINQVLASHGSFTYEAVHEMKYLENCIHETMRLYPPAPFSNRIVTKDYFVPEMNVTLEKGTRVLLPIHAFHNDPTYFPEPERFDPDRFTSEKMASWHPLQFIPFGYGPRNCIGMRFGLMQTRVGLASLLKNFRFSVSPKTPNPIQFDPKNNLTGFLGGMWLKIEKSSMVLIELVGCVILAAFLRWWIRKRFEYWKDRQVAYIEPEFPYGNFRTLGKVEHIAPITRRHYDYFKTKGAPYGGVFMLMTPLLYIFDVKLIKTLLVKDFNYFPNRGVYFNEKDDPLSAHLFAIEGQKWKTLRNKLSPTFTSGRIKMTFPLVVGVCQQFCDHLGELVQSTAEVEMHDLLSRYTIDVIGTCAFGLECNSFRDPDNEFRRYGKIAFDKLPHSPLVVYLMKAFRKYANALGMKQLNDDVSAFFTKVTKETIDYRENNAVSRNDFIDLLLKLKNTGRLEESGEEIGKLSFQEIAAQAFIFFTAGYDTSSTAMTYTLYELALNQEAQERARKCVLDIYAANNGCLTYEAVSNMGYLDQCINETLRKHPPVAILERNADKDYRLPNSDLVIHKGRKIMIPIYAMHHDPDHFPNPDQYEPDRFSAEQVARRDPYCYLPFGEGPRICIGMRFGQIQARVGLASLLRQYRFSICDRTQIPVQYSRTNFILGPANGVWLKVERL